MGFLYYKDSVRVQGVEVTGLAPLRFFGLGKVKVTLVLFCSRMPQSRVLIVYSLTSPILPEEFAVAIWGFWLPDLVSNRVHSHRI